MTQPIQEPSTPRKLSAFGYGQEQLFRRPAPASEDPVEPFPQAWAYRRNVSVATDVPNSTSWTDMTLSEGAAAGVQTALSLQTNSIQIDENGVYLLYLSLLFASGGGGGTWCQGAIRMMNTSGVGTGRIRSQKVATFGGMEDEIVRMAWIYSIPGEQGALPRLGASARQVGGITQQPACLLIVHRLDDEVVGTPAFAWL